MLSDLAALPDVHTLALDVTDDASVKAARDKVAEITGGTLDVLFNNAYVAFKSQSNLSVLTGLRFVVECVRSPRSSSTFIPILERSQRPPRRCLSIAGPGPAAEPDMTLVRSMFATNILGIMSTVKEFAPLVIAAKGKIVSVSSVAGFVGCVLSPPLFLSSSLRTASFLHSLWNVGC